ncbi:MAG: 50S ribosomal protein L15 [Candidatus Margulisiibacteriota bacterium]|jgi:large subunit ribosomal protein L15
MGKLSGLKVNSGAKHRQKRVARGDGSGSGGTAGRGHKGQKSRSGYSLTTGFEGGQMPLYRRTPKQKGFRNHTRLAYQVINVSQLNKFETGDVVDKKMLMGKKMISDASKLVKLLADGEIEKKLTIKVDKASQAAIDKIVKAGGKVEVLVNGQ